MTAAPSQYPTYPQPADAGAEPAQPTQQPCEAPRVHAAIGDLLFADKEWRQYVCSAGCDKSRFARKLETTQAVLRDEPRVVGCFIRPMNAATSVLIAVVLLKGTTPSSYFNFIGIHIGPDATSRTHEYLDLLGEERIDAETWVTHRYVWGKAGYYLESTRVRADTE